MVSAGAPTHLELGQLLLFVYNIKAFNVAEPLDSTLQFFTKIYPGSYYDLNDFHVTYCGKVAISFQWNEDFLYGYELRNIFVCVLFKRTELICKHRIIDIFQ